MLALSLPKRRILLAISLLLVEIGLAQALGEGTTDGDLTDPIHDGLSWAYCGPRPVRSGPPESMAVPPEDAILSLDADEAEYDQERDLVRLRGHIQAERGAQRVAARELVYDRAAEQITVTGDVSIQHPGVRIAADRATLSVTSEQGSLDQTRYRLTGKTNARGTAERAEIVSRDLTRYDEIAYSTCPPGRRDWSLFAKDLELDQARGLGTAHHVRLRVGQVPVLYTPYLRFPLDDRRQSGFLVPSVGTSSESGLDITIPYYFNIAPALDATLAPRYMGRHGLMLGGEARYLTRNQQGKLYGELLPRDRKRADDATRGVVRLEQRGQFGARWRTGLNLAQVSDDRYFEDFGNRIEVTSIRNVERRADLEYLGQGWSVLMRLQGFQTVDESLAAKSRPYQRLPQVRFRLRPRLLGPGVELGGEAEYVYFDHTDNVHGQRVAAAPYLSWPIRRIYGHLIPEVRLYSAHYRLSDQADGASASPSYAIPSLSLDGRLVFERSIDWLGSAALQTLEPRLYYLLTPYEDQEDIPVLDTTELDFSYSSLFRENRFTGRDRIGDANQLTIGLTTRTLAEQSGDELARLSIGQILYFDAANVRIDQASDKDRNSAVAGELALRLARGLKAQASFQWDPNPGSGQESWEKRVVQLGYREGDDRLVNASYRFNLGTTESTRYEDADVSFRWPTGRQVDLVGRWLYSLLYDETMEAFAGIEYGRCCWRLRLIGRHFKNSPDDAGNTSVMLQLELAGLGRFGHKIDELLEENVYGYHAD